MIKFKQYTGRPRELEALLEAEGWTKTAPRTWVSPDGTTEVLLKLHGPVVRKAPPEGAPADADDEDTLKIEVDHEPRDPTS